MDGPETGSLSMVVSVPAALPTATPVPTTPAF